MRIVPKTVSTIEPLRQDIGDVTNSNGFSVILNARTVDQLATSEHGRGPDAAMFVLRWVLWTALTVAEESQRQGRAVRYVFAHPAHVARSFQGRRCSMKRSGMSATTLSRLRSRFLRYATPAKTNDGRVMLKRGRSFYAFSQELIRVLVYECSNAELRAACAAFASLAAAAGSGKQTVGATAERCRRRSKQSAPRWCRAMRKLRIRGLLVDNRPGRRWTANKNMRPRRRLAVHATRLTPLAGERIRWAVDRPESQSELNGQVLKDRKPKAAQSENCEPNQPDPGGVCAELPPEAASPPPAVGTVYNSAPTKPSAESSGSAASPSTHREGASALSDSQRLRTVDVRDILVDAGYGRGNPAMLEAIRTACDTVGVLRRVLEAERDVLQTRTYPVNWLAAICEAEGEAIRDPAWLGSYERRQQSADLRNQGRAAPAQAPESRAAKAVRHALIRAAADPAKLTEAAAMMRATAEREADDDMHQAATIVADHAAQVAAADDAAAAYAALKPAWEWPEFLQAAQTLGAWDCRAWTSGLAIRWRGVGDVTLVAPDESHGRMMAELPATNLDQLARHHAAMGNHRQNDAAALAAEMKALQAPESILERITQALADIYGHGWRVIIQDPSGTHTGMAERSPRSHDGTQRPQESAQPTPDHAPETQEPGRAEAGRAEAGRAEAGRAEAGRSHHTAGELDHGQRHADGHRPTTHDARNSGSADAANRTSNAKAPARMRSPQSQHRGAEDARSVVERTGKLLDAKSAHPATHARGSRGPRANATQELERLARAGSEAAAKVLAMLARRNQ